MFFIIIVSGSFLFLFQVAKTFFMVLVDYNDPAWRKVSAPVWSWASQTHLQSQAGWATWCRANSWGINSQLSSGSDRSAPAAWFLDEEPGWRKKILEDNDDNKHLITITTTEKPNFSPAPWWLRWFLEHYSIYFLHPKPVTQLNKSDHLYIPPLFR